MVLRFEEDATGVLQGPEFLEADNSSGDRSEEDMLRDLRKRERFCEAGGSAKAERG